MVETIGNAILDLIFQLRNLSEASERSASFNPAHQLGREHQLNKIKNFIKMNKPVHMILPAFPAKSPNPEKTVSHEPDYGEVLALIGLNELCERISKIYAPGALMTICSDGRVFSDVVQVDDTIVEIYGREIQKIIRDNKLSFLSTYSLDDVFSKQDYSLMRERLVKEFAETLVQVRDRVKSDEPAAVMFNGIHRFMFEDQIVLRPTFSKTANREHAKNLAYEVIRRSNAWSVLLEQKFPEAIRLSIHPQPLESTKIGIRLLPSNDRWRTPWHAVAVLYRGGYQLMTHGQALLSGGRLHYSNGKYPYFLISNAAEAVS